MRDTQCACGGGVGFAETEREFGDFRASILHLGYFCVSGFPFQEDPVQILLLFLAFLFLFLFCKQKMTFNFYFTQRVNIYHVLHFDDSVYLSVKNCRVIFVNFYFFHTIIYFLTYET